MDSTRKATLANEIRDMGRCFWAGEAEICHEFWDVHAPFETILKGVPG